MIVMRAPTLETLDHDLACAIALGILEHRYARVTLEAITLYDARMQISKVEPGWLNGDDALKVLTRQFLEARRDLNRNPSGGAGAWSAATSAKGRDAALRRAIDAKSAARQFLMERNVLARARGAGMTILEQQ